MWIINKWRYALSGHSSNRSISCLWCIHQLTYFLYHLGCLISLDITIHVVSFDRFVLYSIDIITLCVLKNCRCLWLGHATLAMLHVSHFRSASETGSNRSEISVIFLFLFEKYIFSNSEWCLIVANKAVDHTRCDYGSSVAHCWWLPHTCVNKPDHY